jgi:hydrogenase/urease accessory protein HupE
MLATLAALGGFAAPAAAHEIGTTDVRASFQRGRFTVDVTTAPQSLLNKLEASAGRPLTAAGTVTDLAAALRPFSIQSIESTHIRFDGHDAAAQVEVLPVHETVRGTAVTIRYRGAIPPAAQRFSFQNDLIYTTYALTVEMPDGTLQRQWVEGDAASSDIALAESVHVTRSQLIGQYLELGFTHILPLGLDHVLFVLGMLLVCRRRRDILTQVTAFTVAHSITLGLTIYGVVSVRSSIVEPLIAFSIAFIAIENIVSKRVPPWRILLVFAFGLLHGLGFASVLRELGLPRSEFVTGLVAFNVGVELGQLAVIATAWLLVLRWTERRSWHHARIIAPASLCIALAGIFWTIQRIAA